MEWNDQQRVVQQRLSINGQFNNAVVAQSKGWMSQVIFSMY